MPDDSRHGARLFLCAAWRFPQKTRERPALIANPAQKT